jgi:hypothetical protein
MKEKIRDNILVLNEGVALLKGIDDNIYRQKIKEVYEGTLGGHVRHNLDHYLNFLDGFSLGRIDYEARKREKLIEDSSAYAIEVIEGIVHQLEGIAEGGTDKTIMVKMESDGESVRWAESSALRELEFLLSHTIHHYALLSVMVRLSGIDLDPDFGVAPSTLRFRRSQTPCAP